MKTIRILSIFVFLLIGITVLISSDIAMAQAAEQVQQGVNSIGGEDSGSLQGTVKTLVDTFFYIIGALSVIMIIYGGFRYITSGGDSTSVTSAKNTILYAVIGLVIAMSSYTIANYVIGIFDNSNTDTSSCNGTADPARPECQ